MKKLSRYFLEGLLVLVPLFVTLYVFYWIFTRIDHIFRFEIPGLGFIVTILTVIVTGFVASNFITRRLVRYVDRLFRRLPLVKMIYVSLKDLVGAFVGDKKSFNKPVLVRLVPGSDIGVVGFVTCESLSHIGMPDRVAVYLPQSYNFAGNLIIVPGDQVTPIQADSGTVMAFIVSGGITSQESPLET
ncbi:MAG: DUF502 domain-containing protein [bacterium]